MMMATQIVKSVGADATTRRTPLIRFFVRPHREIEPTDEESDNDTDGEREPEFGRDEDNE